MQQPPATPDFIAHARLPGWLLPSDWPQRGHEPELAHIGLANGRVVSVDVAGQHAPDVGKVWDVQGAPVLPGMVDAHTHLDKAFILPRVGAAEPGLLGAITATVSDRANWTPDDVRRRAERGLQWAWEAGTTRLRTHIDWWDPNQAPAAWHVMSELAQEWRGRIQLEQVAMIPLALFQQADQAQALAHQVASTGSHALMGGLVHSFNWNPVALRHLVEAAQNCELNLDLHVDEELNPQAQGLRFVAELVREIGFSGHLVCGHNCALSALPDAQAEATLDAVAAAPITLVSLPITNLLLQDAVSERTPRLRGLMLVKEARARGIPLLFATDNVQDPFCRVGSFDPLETMQAAALAGQLDQPFDQWSDSLCRSDWLARSPSSQPSLIGSSADLIVFTHTDAHAWPSRTASRVVLRKGRSDFQNSLKDHAS